MMTLAERSEAGPHSQGNPARRSGAGLTWGMTIMLLIILGLSMLIAAGIGQEHYSPAQVWRALRAGPSSQDTVATIVWQIRLPRIVLGALVGAALAAAGVAFQSLLRNDLADPYIIGVSSGASVGAEFVLLRHAETALHGLSTPFAAFGTAFAALSVIYGLARRGGRVHVTSLLLAGVVVSALLGAVSTLMLLLDVNSEGNTQYVLGRLMGSLDVASFTPSAIMAVFFVLGWLILFSQSRAMNIFALGEESAQQLGVETERFKGILIVTGALLTAASVATAGIIGFVGLIVPHIARRLARTPDNRRVLPLATLLGSILLIWADTLARSIMSDGRELPVGVITAFLGAPFFLYLLRRAQQKG